MKQTTCPDCGTVYAVNEHSCPTCGCPNDNYQPQQEEPNLKTVNSREDDFNEGGQYSPFSSTSWFFTTPWPLSNYPERKMFEKAHPFLGWLFGPWYLTCKSKDEKEEYAVINNIFYFFNLIFKTWAYGILWTFFKGWFVELLLLFTIFIFGLIVYGVEQNGSEGSVYVVAFAAVVEYAICLAYGIILLIIANCAIGKALHRYWPSIHRTWRRINKRYWKAMKNQ